MEMIYLAFLTGFVTSLAVACAWVLQWELRHGRPEQATGRLGVARNP